MKKLKNVFSSKWFQLGFSVILIYIAFRKVDISKLVFEVQQVPWWVVVALLVYIGISMFIGGLRWGVLVLDKVNFTDVLSFTRATYAGGFYSLLFPTAIGGDLLKWTSLLKKYPHISKFKLAGTALIDRVIGFSAFAIVAMVALIVGKLFKYQFPDILFWLFLGISVALIFFYILVFSLDFEKILSLAKHLWFYKYLNKLFEIIDLLKKGNKKRIMICFLISLFAEPIWMMTTWFSSLAVGTGLNLLEVMIFMPIISLILVLPISWAGFGARENLFLLFFGQLGISPEKLLLTSAFGGVLGILNSLLGGLVLLF
jgi:glycosyltransferase 2 family protein